MALASPLAGGYLLFGLAFARIKPLGGFGRYGDFSYGLYVYAFPVQQAIVCKFGVDLHPWVFFLYSFAATFPCAVLSWYLVERPFLKKRAAAREPSRAHG